MCNIPVYVTVLYDILGSHTFCPLNLLYTLICIGSILDTTVTNLANVLVLSAPPASAPAAQPAATPPEDLPEIPEKVTYLIVGAGTAAFAAYRSIRSNDPKAQVGQ